MDFLRSLEGKILAVVFAASAILTNPAVALPSMEKYGGQFVKQGERVYEREFPVEIYNNSQSHSETTSIGVTLDVDEQKDSIYLAYYVKDYSRQDWTEEEKKIPAISRHVWINNLSKTYIFHPENIEIAEIEQREFLVPKYAWLINPKPFDENPRAKFTKKIGKKLWNATLGKLPLLDEFIAMISEESEMQIEERLKEICNEIGEKEEYEATEIENYASPNFIEEVMTAKEYRIRFNMKETGKTRKKMYIMSNILLGNPNSSREISYKSGEVNPVFISFYLTENNGLKPVEEKVTNITTQKDKPKTPSIISLKAGDFFLKTRELEGILIAPFEYFTISKITMDNRLLPFKNPAIDPSSLTEEMKNILNKNLETTGRAMYIIPDNKNLILPKSKSEIEKILRSNNFGRVYLRFCQFKNKESALNGFENFDFEKSISFLKGNSFAWITEENILTSQQGLSYANSLLKYIQRVNPDFISWEEISETEIEKETLISALEKLSKNLLQHQKITSLRFEDSVRNYLVKNQ